MYNSDLETEIAEPMRGCADCDNYVAAAKLVAMNDGRRVCQRCKDQAIAKAAQRQQIQLFGQTSIFDSLS